MPPSPALRLAGRLDRLAGGSAGLAGSFVRLGLLFLGTHLAADHLDDAILALFEALRGLAELHLSGPAMGAAAALGMVPGRLLLWRGLALAPAAAALALAVELETVALLWSTVAFVPRDAPATWAHWRRALGLRAVVRPLVLLGVVLAGAWSLGMAIEDALPPGAWAQAAGVLVAGGVLLRHGLDLLRRCGGALDPAPPLWAGAAAAVLLAPVGALAWREGVPVGGLLGGIA